MAATYAILYHSFGAIGLIYQPDICYEGTLSSSPATKVDGMTDPRISNRDLFGPFEGDDVSRVLMKRQVILLILIVGLVVFGQVVLHPMFHVHESDDGVLKLAERQAFLIHSLGESVLGLDEVLYHQLVDPDGSERGREKIQRYSDELRRNYLEWRHNYGYLQESGDVRNLAGDRWGQIERVFKEIDPHFSAIVESVEAVLEKTEKDKAILRQKDFQIHVTAFVTHERPFLAGIDIIASRLKIWAKSRVEKQEFLGLTAAVITLLLLVVLALLSSFPAIRRVRGQMSQLRESRQQFRLAILDAPFPVMIHAENGDVLQISRMWTVLSGYEHQDIYSIGEWTEKAHGPKSHEIQEKIAGLFEGGESSASGDYEIATKQGETRTWSLRSAPLGTLSNGARIRITMAADITERNRTTRALENSEQKFRQITETIREVFWIGSPDWKQVHYVSPAYTEVWGQSAQTLYGKPSSWLSAIHKDDVNDVVATIKKTAGQDFQELEFPDYRVLHPDGSTRWIHAKAYTVHNDAGGFVQIVGIAEDITEYKCARIELRRARDELEKRVRDRTAELSRVNNALQHEVEERATEQKILAESEEQYRTLFNQAPDAIILFDIDSGAIVEFNDQACRNLGYTRHEFSSLKLKDIEAIESPEEIEIHIRDLLDGARLPFETKHRTKSGDLREVLVHARPITLGGHTYIQSICADRTAQKRAEEGLRAREAELAHVARLNTMGATIAGLAHELTQPLNAVSNYADACIRMVAPEAVGELPVTLEKVAQQAERAGKIIHRVKHFVRKKSPHRSTASLNDLIRESVDLVQMDATLNRISISLDLSETLPPVLCDEIQIQQVILNLLRNSVDAMRASESHPRLLSIASFVEPEDRVVVAVVDTGKQIPADVRSRLFEPFFTTKMDGMGLGLSLSRTIIESHKGKLSFSENADVGMTFCFSIPIK